MLLFLFSMEGGELFTRIQDRTAFNERGKIVFCHSGVFTHNYVGCAVFISSLLMKKGQRVLDVHILIK